MFGKFLENLKLWYHFWHSAMASFYVACVFTYARIIFLFLHASWQQGHLAAGTRQRATWQKLAHNSIIDASTLIWHLLGTVYSSEKDSWIAVMKIPSLVRKREKLFSSAEALNWQLFHLKHQSEDFRTEVKPSSVFRLSIQTLALSVNKVELLWCWTLIFRVRPTPITHY